LEGIVDGNFILDLTRNSSENYRSLAGIDPAIPKKRSNNNFPAYLNNQIEQIQKRALRITYPSFTYSQGMFTANLPSLYDRRSTLIQYFIVVKPLLLLLLIFLNHMLLRILSYIVSYSCKTSQCNSVLTAKLVVNKTIIKRLLKQQRPTGFQLLYNRVRYKQNLDVYPYLNAAVAAVP
jgi:hypothetical protein